MERLLFSGKVGTNGTLAALRRIGLALAFVVGGVGVVQAQQLTLTWTDTSNNEDGFRVERKDGMTGTFSEIATTEMDVATYVDTAVAWGETYTYRVRAYNKAGNSAYSNEASAILESVPSAPTDLLISEAQAAIGEAQERLGIAQQKLAQVQQHETR